MIGTLLIWLCVLAILFLAVIGAGTFVWWFQGREVKR